MGNLASVLHMMGESLAPTDSVMSRKVGRFNSSAEESNSLTSL